MHDNHTKIRPVINRQPVHLSITSDQISVLVENFYDRIRSDERLGPIFNKRLEKRWDAHLTKMKTFWESVLLRTGTYHGKPVPAHLRLKEVVSDDYRIWLELFRQTATECFDPEAAPLVIGVAERIAQSLWLAMFSTPISTPPSWMYSGTEPA